MRYKTSGLIWKIMPSNSFQSSTFPICLNILGIFLARPYREVFNSIKRTLIQAKKWLFFFFFQKMSCLALEGRRTAMIILCFSGHMNTWTFSQQKWISIHLHWKFGSYHVIPGSCALSYLHSCLLNCPWILKSKCYDWLDQSRNLLNKQDCIRPLHQPSWVQTH